MHKKKKKYFTNKCQAELCLWRVSFVIFYETLYIYLDLNLFIWNYIKKKNSPPILVCQANGVYQSLIYKSAGLVQTSLQPQIEPILQKARKVSEDSNLD